MLAWEFMLPLGAGVASLLTTFWFFLEVRRGPVSLDSHWGGLGTTGAGWRASNALVALVVTLAAWFVSAGVGIFVVTDVRAEEHALREDAKLLHSGGQEGGRSVPVRQRSDQEPPAATAPPETSSHPAASAAGTASSTSAPRASAP